MKEFEDVYRNIRLNETNELVVLLRVEQSRVHVSIATH